MEKQLILLDHQTGKKVQRIDFGSCYYGCNLTSLGILFNSSPEKVEYVILLEQKGPGGEIVSRYMGIKFIGFIVNVLKVGQC